MEINPADLINLLINPTTEDVETLNFIVCKDSAIAPVPHTVWAQVWTHKGFAEEDGRENDVARYARWQQRMLDMQNERIASLQLFAASSGSPLTSCAKVVAQWLELNPHPQLADTAALDKLNAEAETIQGQIRELMRQRDNLQGRNIFSGDEYEAMSAEYESLCSRRNEIRHEQWLAKWGI